MIAPPPARAQPPTFASPAARGYAAPTERTPHHSKPRRAPMPPPKTADRDSRTNLLSRWPCRSRCWPTAPQTPRRQSRPSLRADQHRDAALRPERSQQPELKRAAHVKPRQRHNSSRLWRADTQHQQTNEQDTEHEQRHRAYPLRRLLPRVLPHGY